MSATKNAPIIIKRKKIVAAEGHHGGAWKVAYADFVTAMMAFFMLMWLLNVATEQQRQAIADYFSPNIPIVRVSGGGAGALGGNNPTLDSRTEFEGEGSAPFQRGTPIKTMGAAEIAAVAALREAEAELLGKGGESLISDEALRHVATRVTDEGLVIELFDRGDTQLFEDRSAIPTELTRALVARIGQTFAKMDRDFALAAYVRSSTKAEATDLAWPLSMERATVFRQLLLDSGLGAERIRRATGFGDSVPVSEMHLSTRNNRIEVIVLKDSK